MKNKLLIGGISLISLTSLTSCDAFKEGEFAQKLFGSWQALLIQLGATLIMFGLIGFLVFKPVRKLIQQRKDYVVNQVTTADKIKLKAEEQEKEANNRIKSLNNEAKTIIETAKKNAEDLKQNAYSEIEEEKLNQKRLLAKQLEQEKEKAKEEIRKEIVSVALDATSAILEREVKEQDNKKILDDFIKEVGTDE